ncbi:MAG: hypothetical protein GY730_06260 [bacterium]|nr:hypothetical protein [bacterium]
MEIRLAKSKDIDDIWNIFQAVIKTGDSYVFDPDTPRKDLNKHWLADYIHTFVAEIDGQVLGTYILKRNHIDPGSHVANGSYMVHPEAHGKNHRTLGYVDALIMYKKL